MTKTLVAMGDDDDDRLDLSRLLAARARRAQQQAALDIFRHGLRAAVMAECDCQDAQAAVTASEVSLDCEMGLLDRGLNRADGSAAKVELVVRKVNALASWNDRRLARRFGR